jgi:hypothetical protein
LAGAGERQKATWNWKPVVPATYLTWPIVVHQKGPEISLSALRNHDFTPERLCFQALRYGNSIITLIVISFSPPVKLLNSHVWIWKPLTNNLRSHPFFPINNSAQFRERGRYLHKILISMDPLGYFTRVLLYLYLSKSL